MAASDEFPRGWSISAIANGAGTATVTMPAVAGISHVITDIHATLIAFGAVAVFGPFVAVQFNAVNQPQPSVQLVVASTGAMDRDSWDWSGKIAAPLGQSIGVTFTAAAVANVIETIVLSGYDI